MSDNCAILDSSGLSYAVNNSVLDSAGVPHLISSIVLDSNGNPYEVCSDSGGASVPYGFTLTKELRADEEIVMQFVREYMKRVH